MHGKQRGSGRCPTDFEAGQGVGREAPFVFWWGVVFLVGVGWLPFVSFVLSDVVRQDVVVCAHECEGVCEVE